MPVATVSKKLIVDSYFSSDIVSLTEFPGMRSDIFRSLVENNGVKAFILRSFGAADVSHHLIKSLEYLKESHIPIVITTQAPSGNANMQVNEPGAYVKENALGIPAYDMSIESQTVKLSWLLSKLEKNEISYQRLAELMVTDMKGEIRVLWEDAW
jgi:L-asparaginase/Glu-tRNA(Gln) amidotransferase subunit D